MTKVATSPATAHGKFLPALLAIASHITSRQARLGMCLGLIAATLIVYWPVTRADFITFDDLDYVTDNPHVRSGLTWPGILWALQTGHSANWHPVTWISHMVDVKLFGLRPGWHHLANVLFHAANAVLLLLLLHRMTGAVWRSAMVAAPFALHPLHVESVAWVSERKDVLSTFFGLLAIWAYVAYVAAKGRRPKRASDHGPNTDGTRKEDGSGRGSDPGPRTTAAAHSLQPGAAYALALFLFALSLMSKPMLVTLPFLLLLLDYWPLGRLQFGARGSSLKALLCLLREKLPFLMLSVVSCVITLMVQKRGEAVLSLEAIPIGARLGNAAVSYVRYVGKMVWPSGLALPYPHPGVWPASTVLLAALVLIGASALALWWARSRPYVAVGWLWFVGTLVPVIGVVQVGAQASADRYTYVPLVGLFVMVTWLAGEWMGRWRHGRVALAAVSAAVVGACVVGTRVQASYWKDSETLFCRALAVTGENAEAENNLGTSAALQQRFDDAVAHYEKALKLDPTWSSVHRNLGIVLALQGQRPDEARRHLLVALAQQPNNVSLSYRLASVATSQGSWTEAIGRYQRALELRPVFPEARNELGFALLQSGRLEEAAAEFTAAIKSRPAFAAAHYNLGLSRLKQERTQEAIDEFRLALRLRPNWAGVLNNLAWLLATHPSAEFRNGAEAVALAERACQLTRSTNAAKLATLAAAYAEAGRFAEAVSAQQRVCKLAAARGQTNQAQVFQRRLELYRSGHAYHKP